MKFFVAALILSICTVNASETQSRISRQRSLNLDAAPTKVSKAKAFYKRAAFLFQTQNKNKMCDVTKLHDEACEGENAHVLIVLCGLCAAIVAVVCAFAFFREDKEEQITPLCPQLVVKESELRFKLPLDSNVDAFEVTDMSDERLCKVAMDWPDPFRPGISGVAATVRLQNILELTLATVVARTPTLHVAGQGLALCRAGCEIFGFVEPDGEKRYHVRHRTGVHLLTLVGDFTNFEIEGLNPVGSKVCEIQKIDGVCVGRVLQHVDAGLVICSLLATHVHRRLPYNSDAGSASIPQPLAAPEVKEEAAPQEEPSAASSSTTSAEPVQAAEA